MPILTSADEVMNCNVYAFYHAFYVEFTLSRVVHSCCQMGVFHLRCCSIEVLLLWYASSILLCTHTTMLSLIFNVKSSHTFDIFCLFLLLLSLCCVCLFSLFSVLASSILYSKTVHTRYQKPASVFSRFIGNV